MCPRCAEREKIEGRSYCALCLRDYNQNYYQTTKHRRRARWTRRDPVRFKRALQKYRRSAKGKQMMRRSYLKYEYGMSSAEYDALLEEQGHRCAICKEKKKLEVDHCHATGVRRGLLCGKCNKGLGFMRDRISSLKAAILYLEQYAALGDSIAEAAKSFVVFDQDDETDD